MDNEGDFLYVLGWFEFLNNAPEQTGELGLEI